MVILMVTIKLRINIGGNFRTAVNNKIIEFIKKVSSEELVVRS